MFLFVQSGQTGHPRGKTSLSAATQKSLERKRGMMWVQTAPLFCFFEVFQCWVSIWTRLIPIQSQFKMEESLCISLKLKQVPHINFRIPIKVSIHRVALHFHLNAHALAWLGFLFPCPCMCLLCWLSSSAVYFVKLHKNTPYKSRWATYEGSLSFIM